MRDGLLAIQAGLLKVHWVTWSQPLSIWWATCCQAHISGCGALWVAWP